MTDKDLTTDVVAETLTDCGTLVAQLPEQSPQRVPAVGRLTVGRDESCSIVLEDASVSRRHAAFHFERGPEVEDLGSRNGVRVAGRLIAKNSKVRLEPGVVVELGRAVIVYYEATAVAPSSAAPSIAPDQESAMARVERLIAMVARGGISVILKGETGVGKDVFAERLHRLSDRRDKPLVAINCAAIADNLIESELFGHEKGAFTGAASAKIGLLEAAGGGTVFLDELGELPASTQAKLLRALEKKEVLPVGATKPRAFHARFVAATHRDLDAMVASGAFRSDLYFRLNGVTIAIPPLRERLDEIAHLARAFANEAASEMGLAAVQVEPSAIAKLSRYSFPGNIRELRNIIERAALLSDGGNITQDHIELPQAQHAPPSSSPLEGGGLKSDVASVERHRIEEALAKTGGNQTRAAELLGITRRALVNKLNRYQFERPRKGR